MADRRIKAKGTVVNRSANPEKGRSNSLFNGLVQRLVSIFERTCARRLHGNPEAIHALHAIIDESRSAEASLTAWSTIKAIENRIRPPRQP